MNGGATGVREQLSPPAHLGLLPKSRGTGMQRAVALSLLLFLCTGAKADEGVASCNEHPLASLPLYFAPDGAMATDVDVGAPQPLEFRIDLIGGDTELRDDVAAALHLRQT